MGNKQPQQTSNITTNSKKINNGPKKQYENTERPENKKELEIIQSKNSELNYETKQSFNQNLYQNYNADVNYDIELI